MTSYRSSRRRPSFRLAAVAVAAGLLLAACGGGGAGDSTVGQKPEQAEGLAESTIKAAAQAEGKVVWYTSIPEAAVKEVAAGFKAAYGIDVEVVRLTSTTLMQRYASERDAGAVKGDVINVAQTAFFEDGVKKNWWSKLTEPEAPMLASWPKDLVHKDQYTLINTQPIGIAYNKDQVKESDVDTWQKIVDPRFKNKVVLVNPANTPFYLSWLKLMETEYGPDVLTQFAALKPTVTDSAVPGAQQLAAGERVLMVPNVLSGVKEVVDAGAPVATVTPSPTVGVEQYAAASADGPHPNAAKLLLGYLLTRTGQEQLNRGYAASPLSGIPGSIPMPKDYRSTDTAAMQADKSRLLAAVGLSS
ncbi:extracellular solute-binding protein [Dactylosporangium sp. NPDC006015]|uniref:ABC transporter substrate-binding protein n=1 Tax=unclassified Dactylosporangium TaxID=2621675 RepID=UPI0033AAE329